jgi:hypothetical protein
VGVTLSGADPVFATTRASGNPMRSAESRQVTIVQAP